MYNAFMNARDDSTARIRSLPLLSPVREKWINIAWCVALALAIVGLISIWRCRAGSDGPDPLMFGESLGLLTFGIAIPLAGSVVCAAASAILGKFRWPI